MSEKVKIIFEDNEEILNVISSGESIDKILGLPSENCSLIGTEIKLGKIIGKGENAVVFEVNIQGMGTRKYVVKKGKVYFQTKRTTKNTLLQYLQTQNMTWNDIKNFQLDAEKNVFDMVSGQYILLVLLPPKICRLSENKSFTAFPKLHGIPTVGVPKGSYLCENELMSEFIISVYTGKLYRDRICVNFFNVFSTFICPDKQYTFFQAKFDQYIFMDKLDGILDDYKSCILLKTYMKTAPKNNEVGIDAVAACIYIQVMFAIAIYQEQLLLSHNDLHTKNIFIEFVKPETQFSFQNIYDAMWYHYNLGEGKDIYFPAIPIIAKIGDYGYSVKYSTPIVGNKYVFTSGYKIEDKPGIPNVYIPSYDSLFFSVAFANLLSPEFLPSKLGEIVTESIYFMCDKLPPFDKKKGNNQLIDNLIKLKYIRMGSIRPVLENLFIVKSAKDVLLGPILNRYGKKPTNQEKIVTLGGFDRI